MGASSDRSADLLSSPRSAFVAEVETYMIRARKRFFPSLALVPALVAMALVVMMGVSTAEPAAAASDPCASPVTSIIACENSLAGTPRSDWDVTGTGDTSIQGFATAMSVNAGSTVSFRIKTTADAYRIDILRLGYYQGNGARKIVSGLLPSATLPQNQPACLTFSATGLIDCGNWAQSASWSVPATAVSGVYIAHLIRIDTGGDSLIPFVVRNDASTSDIVFQTSDETWQAYNNYGGNSLYTCTVSCPPGDPLAYRAAFAVSYNRPFTPTFQGPNWLMDTEMPMIRFMEANGYDVTYQAGVDTSTRGALLLNHEVFMSTGHDEYWDGLQRANVEAARDAGVNLAFFSGNEVFWKTRWAASSDGSSTPDRTIVCYKDTHFNAPTDPVSWTGTWRDPRYGTTGGGGNPENALTGQFFLVNSGSADIKVPAEYASMRLWRNTAAAALTGTQSLTLGSGLNTLGYEWDVDSDNGFRPAGSFRLSSTTVSAPEVFTDYGSTVAPATVTHNLTMHRAPSGALVFGAGTVQWSYGLDSYPNRAAPDRNMQQATVNLFADMGAQPATLITGLVAGTKSTDTTAPASVITSGLNGQTLADGAKITIAGTASDSGGVVAGVEVSTDSGATWHPATGKGTWTFSWIAHGSPTTNVKTRAVDDSGNLEIASAGATVDISCPCSIFGANVIPDIADSGDPRSVEVGLRFTSDTPGAVTGLRFYKSTNNQGTHTGSLWSSTGQRLATANFSSETASGWQSVTFSTPVIIAANSGYVVSYFAPQGHYAQAAAYLYPHPSPTPAGSSSVDSAPLHATRSTPAQGNGLYIYSSTSTFPSNSFNAENYWVDIIYTPGTSTAPTVGSTAPAAGATGVAVSVTPSATFDQAVTPASITFTLKDATGTAVTGTTGYNSTSNTMTFTPTGTLAYNTAFTATVSGATNTTGQTLAAPKTWTFTTAAPGACPCTVFSPNAIPATITDTDTGAVELGMKFRSDVAGTATGIRFYKGSQNTGTHTGHLWTSTGTLLASVTFTGETASGWQQATLSTPITINANTTYVVSYYAPNGRYSATSNYFTTSTDNGPLHGLATGTDGSNGIYKYGTTTFPTSSYNNTNYWVDITFMSGNTAPTVGSTAPAAGATGVAVSVTPSATFDQAVTPASITFTLKDATGTAVTGTTGYNSTSNTMTFTPTGTLAYNTAFTATVSGATNTTGQTLAAPKTWTFTTAAPGACPCTVFSPNAIPATITDTDTGAVELGMKFRSDVAGTATGIRFYKGSQNTGTHTGHLWTSTGTLLASVTFTGETASGWQQATLSTPITINANTTYVVSYYAPNGRYSATSNYFTTSTDNGPLHGLATGTDGSNGIYKYGTTTFPTSSYNNTNYWVDITFMSAP